MSSEPINAEPDVEPDAGELDDTAPLLAEDASAAGTMSSPVADRVYALLGPVVATAGVELLDVEWTGGTLRVVLDHEDGVTTDSLTTVNRLISPILDQHDPVPGRYTLEVSSPGVERPLRRLEHYHRAVGESIVAKMVPGSDPRRVKGLLRSVGDTGIELDVTEVDGVGLAQPESMSIDLAEITSARTVFDWGPTPKPGTAKQTGAKSGVQSKNDSAARNKNRRQSQRKAKKGSGAKAAGKPSKQKPKSGAAESKKRQSKKQQSKKPQPNTAEQERGRP